MRPVTQSTFARSAAAITVLLLFVDEGVASSSFTDTSFHWKLKGRSSAEMFFFLRASVTSCHLACKAIQSRPLWGCILSHGATHSCVHPLSVCVYVLECKRDERKLEELAIRRQRALCAHRYTQQTVRACAPQNILKSVCLNCSNGVKDWMKWLAPEENDQRITAALWDPYIECMTMKSDWNW